MTPDQQAKADEIVRRLLGKDKPGRTEEETKRMAELADKVIREWCLGRWGEFLAAAKELNGIYKEIAEEDRWEVGGDR